MAKRKTIIIQPLPPENIRHNIAKTARIRELEKRVKQLEAAIRWALGEEGSFGAEPPPLAGKYRRRFWWRTELRRRAFPRNER